MYFILYAMLTCNLLMCTLAYSRGDMPGVRHAVCFAITAVVAMGLVWMSRREGR